MVPFALKITGTQKGTIIVRTFMYTSTNIYIYTYTYTYKDAARDSIPNSPLGAHKEQACLE